MSSCCYPLLCFLPSFHPCASQPFLSFFAALFIHPLFLPSPVFSVWHIFRFPPAQLEFLPRPPRSSPSRLPSPPCHVMSLLPPSFSLCLAPVHPWLLFICIFLQPFNLIYLHFLSPFCPLVLLDPTPRLPSTHSTTSLLSPTFSSLI